MQKSILHPPQGLRSEAKSFFYNHVWALMSWDISLLIAKLPQFNVYDTEEYKSGEKLKGQICMWDRWGQVSSAYTLTVAHLGFIPSHLLLRFHCRRLPPRCRPAPPRSPGPWRCTLQHLSVMSTESTAVKRSAWARSNAALFDSFWALEHSHNTFAFTPLPYATLLSNIHTHSLSNAQVGEQLGARGLDQGYFGT